jgi:hypothetical protein
VTSNLSPTCCDPRFILRGSHDRYIRAGVIYGIRLRVMMKSGLGTILALLRAVHRRHRRVALWMTITVTSIEVAATWHNARLLNTR